jgi:hypothetical protein
MPLFTRAQIWAVSTLRCVLAGLLASAVIGTSAVLTTLPAHADPAVSAKSGSFTIRGAGWGHGWGMSQYGAYGAARTGLSWKQILAFYYRGTQLSTMPSGTKIKVWIGSDNDNSLRVCRRAVLPCATQPVVATPCQPVRSTPRGESAAPALATG